jgi:AcrR family transcriptional regulator
MNNTKEKILQQAKTLFNKAGYRNVTIRMIALEVGMSSGNLNYHYKKREDILEALYFQMVSVFDERIEKLGREELTLSKMQKDIHVSINRMVDYTFFWTDLFYILSSNTTIKKHFDTVYEQRKKGLEFVFNAFINTTILKPFEFKFERTNLIEQMVNFGNTWMYASSLYTYNELTPTYIKTQTSALMAYLYPYLTDLGKDEFRKLFPEYFD